MSWESLWWSWVCHSFLVIVECHSKCRETTICFNKPRSHPLVWASLTLVCCVIRCRDTGGWQATFAGKVGHFHNISPLSSRPFGGGVGSFAVICLYRSLYSYSRTWRNTCTPSRPRLHSMSIIASASTAIHIQEAHGPWCFADMLACHKRSSYLASLVQTVSSYLKSLLTKSQMPAM